MRMPDVFANRADREDRARTCQHDLLIADDGCPDCPDSDERQPDDFTVDEDDERGGRR